LSCWREWIEGLRVRGEHVYVVQKRGFIGEHAYVVEKRGSFGEHAYVVENRG